MDVDYDSDSEIPSDIADIANSAIANMLPAKSRFIYEKNYNQFPEWCGKKNIQKVSEKSVVAFGPIIITISLGLAEGYSAILLPQLQEDPTWSISTELSSWIASIATLPMSVGCLLGGWLMEAIGRKMLHLATCIPNLIGWLLIAFCGHSIPMLLAGRFITGYFCYFVGMCVGVLGPVLAIYIAETSDPVYRGFLLPCISLALNLGIAIAHIMGTYLTWELVAILACIYPVSCFVLMLFVPESPTYLIKRGKVEKARKGFLWCRGDSDESKKELDILVAKQKAEANLPKNGFAEHLKTFKRPEFYKPFYILVIFFSTMQWAGNNPIAFYTVNILQDVLGDATLDPYTSMLIMDGMRIISSILGCFAQHFMKRRKLMMYSCSGTLISLFILSGFLFAAKGQSSLTQEYSWIPLAALVGYVLFINVGLLPLPYSMSGELFGQASRGLGSGIVTLFNMILMFVLVKITPLLFETLGTAGVFLLFGVCCFLGMVALIIVLPETKDKPLHEIEHYFKDSKSENADNSTTASTITR